MKKIRGIYTLLLVRRNLLLNIILNYFLIKRYSKKKNGYEFYTRRNIEYYGDEYSCEFHIELCNVSSVTGYSDNFLEIEYTGDILKNVKSKEYPNGYWTFTNDIIKTSSIVESLEKLFEEIGETDFEDKKYVELILGE